MTPTTPRRRPQPGAGRRTALLLLLVLAPGPGFPRDGKNGRPGETALDEFGTNMREPADERPKGRGAAPSPGARLSAR